ncbi:phosphoinositide phospholipase C [Neohortaea acidophila]|uniref:Phosphoinositide phospholipase C n=1 Tax=Neohortaea acidophila TaxID=245834 RepID=A0A6A6PW19_9PEZI|nr:phosphoinositide phospholipase C [Neohortaea acidophila]KAF2483934.1 phosphoinositide phospholipase C [Neohortaea acidophila]
MPHSMADAIGSNSKSPGGLIRRLSRGAHQKLRRRASQQQSLRLRDQSAGPVLVRRRSDSNAASDRAPDVSDLELEPSENGTQDDSPHPPTARDIQNGLGINLSRPSNASSYFEGGIAPAISAILQTGTLVTKHTSKHKKNKRIRLWLDPNSARVCWSLTNSGKSFFIDDVREVRVGAESRNARDDVQIADEDEGRWMTVVYEPPERSKGRTIKTMHLVFDSVVIVGYWTDALGSVARERTEIMNALSTRTEKSERSMAMVWRRAMGRKSSDDDHSFTLDDARWFCRKLEINCSDSAVRTHFTLADTGYTGKLDYTRYQIFVRSFMERKDIQNLYRNINFGTDLDLGLEAFLDFLRDDQGVDVEKERSHWEGVFEKFAKPSQNRAALPTAEPVGRQLALNQQSFRSFLTSAYNSPLLPSKGEGTLDRPLNEYFISSSHNTYLLGRQVYGASSVEGYISALIKGCRCIEIDCWDGENGRPMVTHGRTMTTKVPFEDCVSTIAKYAFHSSPYPLIVSLEVHCNAEQQKTMVDHMLKYWKTMLVTEALSANTQILPTPEELKSRILLKVKAAGAEEPEPFQFPLDGSNGRSRARSLGSTIVRTPSIDKRAFTYSPLVISPVTTSPSDTTVGTMSTPRGSITSGPTVSPSSSAEDSDTSQTPLEKTRKRKSSKIIPELGRLGVYAQGIKFPGFNEPGAKSFNHIFSFNENTFGRLCTKQTETKGLLEKHNVHYLMRVYPKAGRIDSSNFNPLEAWRRGVQMAALNWQTYDVHQQVNEAMFAAGSDRVGYVLKPEELRHSKHIPILDAGEKKEKKDKKFVKFTVDIISAQRLPRPLRQITESGMNPYIEFEMYCADDKAPGGARGEGGTDASAPNGYSGIGSPLRKRTKVIEGNGFDPIWNQPLTVSLVTKHTSLIFVRWTVWSSPEARPTSSNNVLLATFTAKLDSLQQGYRHLPLFNPQGEQYRDAKLFVKIRKENAFPIQLGALRFSADRSRTPRAQLEVASLQSQPQPAQTGGAAVVFALGGPERAGLQSDVEH